MFSIAIFLHLTIVIPNIALILILYKKFLPEKNQKLQKLKFQKDLKIQLHESNKLNRQSKQMDQLRPMEQTLQHQKYVDHHLHKYLKSKTFFLFS